MPGDPLDWIDDELARLRRSDLLRARRVRTAAADPRRLLLESGPASKPGCGSGAVNFGSNDYLGLAADERLRAAAALAAQNFGVGSGASPLITGRGRHHAALEQELAEFEGTEGALLFSSGYAANVAVIPALAGRGDAVFSDADNHASIIDGCRLSGAAVCVYRHRDVRHLAALLSETAAAARRRLIVTDSLFSMGGDLAPLGDLAALARRHRAMLVVDEAHATGVLGERGRGAAELLGAQEGISIRVGTLSKALGCAGGFVAGPRRLIDWLYNRARSYVFSTSSPEPIAAAARKSLQIVRDEPERRRSLLSRAEALRGRLKEAGLNIGGANAQIIPVYLGEPRTALTCASRLADAGLFVPAIRPPSVPPGKSLLRVSLSAAHDEQAIDRLAEALIGVCG